MGKRSATICDTKSYFGSSSDATPLFMKKNYHFF